MVVLASVVILVVLGLSVFNKATRAGYETAEYKVVESDGNYEVREYPDLMLVATRTNIDAQGRDGSFMKLFRYISGETSPPKRSP